MLSELSPSLDVSLFRHILVVPGGGGIHTTRGGRSVWLGLCPIPCEWSFPLLKGAHLVPGDN